MALRSVLFILLLFVSQSLAADTTLPDKLVALEREDPEAPEFDKGTAATAVAEQHFETNVKYVVVGFTSDTTTPAADEQLFVARFVSTGKTLDVDKTFANGKGFLVKKVGRSTRAWDVHVIKNNHIIVSGWGYDAISARNCALIFHYDSNGNFVGEAKPLVINATHGRRMSIDGAGSFILGGSYSGQGGNDSFVARFQSNLQLDTAGFAAPNGYVTNGTAANDGLFDVVVHSTSSIFGAGYDETARKGIAEKYTSSGVISKRVTLADSNSRYWGIASGERDTKPVIVATGYQSGQIIVDLYDDSLAKIGSLTPPVPKSLSVGHDVVLEDNIVFVAGNGKPAGGAEDKRHGLLGIFQVDAKPNYISIDFNEGTSDRLIGLTKVWRPNQIVCVGMVRISETEGYCAAIALCHGVTGKPEIRKVWSVPSRAAERNQQ